MHVFCLAMDNYFTLPKILKILREKNIGVVGTSRFRQNWPPKKLREVEQNSAQFNSFHHCIDEFGNLVARWMDNGLVLCVSTLHKVGEVIKRKRKRPRKTHKNKNHVDIIWKDNPVAEIYIPTLIDDYNHWMGGVDLTDQMIAYYHPDLRCRRNWIPILLQILSIIRGNSYIAHRQFFKKNANTHKKFTLNMIAYLMHEAHSKYTKALPTIRKQVCQVISKKRFANSTPRTLKKATKRPRLQLGTSSSELYSKFPARMFPPRKNHVPIKAGKRGSCIVCAFIFNQAKRAGEEVIWDREVKRTATICSICSDASLAGDTCFLCRDHFDTFHDSNRPSDISKKSSDSAL